MKIKCPTCHQPVPAEQVNMAKDLALCPACNEGFRVSETMTMATETVSAESLSNPPKGVWVREEADGIVLGATTRSPIALFLVPFMCVWSGGSLGGIYGSQIAKGEFNLEMSLFGIPFLLGSILFWAIALMTVAGKTEIKIGKNRSAVFTGVGPVGWRRPFDWSAVKTIREATSTVRRNRQPGRCIVLEGQQRIRFGSGLTENRRYFLLNALKYLKQSGR